MLTTWPLIFQLCENTGPLFPQRITEISVLISVGNKFSCLVLKGFTE